jgi:hypothetical protein
LIDYAIRMDATKLAQLISATPGAHFFNENIEKTSQSIRANLIAELRFLEFLRDDAEALSIRTWMKNPDPSFLFLTGDAEHAAATRNIISAILEVAANSLMALGPASEPRCYFFMDELPSLNRLPFLVSSLAEIRQFGGAFVLGYQVYSQLEDIYGREAAQSISGTTNNRVVFNTPDFRTAKICSETLGNTDHWEANSNISVGAHEARDGVGFTQQRVERSIVSPAEIQNLPQFHAFVKFAYDSPTAAVSMKLVEMEEEQARFQPYLGDKLGPTNFVPREDDKAPEERDHIAEFHEWCGWRFDCTDINFACYESAPHPKFAAYFSHFEGARRSGVEAEAIKPIVLVNRGLVQNARRHDPKPDPATLKAVPRGDANSPPILSRSLEQPPPFSTPVQTAFLLEAQASDVAADPGPRLTPTPAEPNQPALPVPDAWSPTSKWAR